MIPRILENTLINRLNKKKAIILLGPRQVGKTFSEMVKHHGLMGEMKRSASTSLQMLIFLKIYLSGIRLRNQKSL